MGVSALVKDGEIVKTASQESVAGAKQSGSVNKDDFLQLLVAQMKYQDPMEPTENTEWVSQYAQFTQVEEMQNMAQSFELTRASSLVGQTVIMEVTGENGKTTEVQGNVDYVSYEGGKAYLSIEGNLYSLDDLSLVVDDIYLTDAKNASTFIDAMDELPELEYLTLSDKDAVVSAATIYDKMSERAREMAGKDYITAIEQYAIRIKELMKAEEEKDTETTA